MQAKIVNKTLADASSLATKRLRLFFVSNQLLTVPRGFAKAKINAEFVYRPGIDVASPVLFRIVVLLPPSIERIEKMLKCSYCACSSVPLVPGFVVVLSS